MTDFNPYNILIEPFILINFQANKILTMWQIKEDGYKKIKEIYIWENINMTIEFSK